MPDTLLITWITIAVIVVTGIILVALLTTNNSPQDSFETMIQRIQQQNLKKYPLPRA